MTPIDQRGVPVSEGDGAKAQGRDTSPVRKDPKLTKEEQAREVPRNLTAEQIADTLRATAPSLTFAAAYAVAKAMIGPAPKEFPATEADTKKDDSVKKVTFEASA